MRKKNLLLFVFYCLAMSGCMHLSKLSHSPESKAHFTAAPEFTAINLPNAMDLLGNVGFEIYEEDILISELNISTHQDSWFIGNDRVSKVGVTCIELGEGKETDRYNMIIYPEVFGWRNWQQQDLYIACLLRSKNEKYPELFIGKIHDIPEKFRKNVFWI